MDKPEADGGYLIPAELQPHMDELLKHNWQLTYEYTIPAGGGMHLVPFSAMKLVKVEKLCETNEPKPLP